MMVTEKVDLDDTTHCPRGVLCESCGRKGRHDVATADTPMGVLCLTLCERCARSGSLPRLKPVTVVRLVGEHAAHLGITVDEMEANR